MTSLAEVYDSGNAGLRRLYAGTALFVGGAGMVLLAITIASTDLLANVGIGVYTAREIAGILGGVGVPAVFLGIFTVLPASRRERIVAALGAGVALVGVGLFAYAYPSRWVTATPDHLTLPVVTIYFLGAITTFWSLFTAVVSFKQREPGGTVTLRRTIEGTTELIEVPKSELESTLGGTGKLGGVGVFGGVERGDTDPTPAGSDDGAVLTGEPVDPPDATSRDGRPQGATTGDGGTTRGDLRTPGGPDDALAGTPDAYCGNCAHFDYVRTEDGMQPYCGAHDELMDDMDPCERWEPNAPGRQREANRSRTSSQ